MRFQLQNIHPSFTLPPKEKKAFDSSLGHTCVSSKAPRRGTLGERGWFRRAKTLLEICRSRKHRQSLEESRCESCSICRCMSQCCPAVGCGTLGTSRWARPRVTRNSLRSLQTKETSVVNERRSPVNAVFRPKIPG